MIAIIDYKAGNLHNLKNAFDKIDASCRIFDSPEGLEDAEKIVLPGVGSFGFCANNLRLFGFEESLKKAFEQKKPILGICVGMQLFFDSGEESKDVKGLGFIPGQVHRFEHDKKIPQIGWNTVFFKEDPIFEGIKNNEWFYFVHSYCCRPEDKKRNLGITNYGQPFCSVVKDGSLYGFQFHPEKSHDSGLKLLKNFCDSVC